MSPTEADIDCGTGGIAVAVDGRTRRKSGGESETRSIVWGLGSLRRRKMSLVNNSIASAFINSYTNLVTSVWSDPQVDAEFDSDPIGVMERFGLVLPDGVQLTVLRDTGDAAADLDVQVENWFAAKETGRVSIVVPRKEPMTTGELNEDELLGVVAGISTSCACCCPCCCA